MATFNYFKSFISQNLKKLKRDVKRYQRAVNIFESQDFYIHGHVYSEKKAVFSAKVKSQTYDDYYYTTISIIDGNFSANCTCKDRCLCKHSIALSMAVSSFRATEFIKTGGSYYTKLKGFSMLIQSEETLFDIENGTALKALSEFMDRISDCIPEEIWDEINYEYVEITEELKKHALENQTISF